MQAVGRLVECERDLYIYIYIYMFSVDENNRNRSVTCYSFVHWLYYVAISPFIYFDLKFQCSNLFFEWACQDF